MTIEWLTSWWNLIFILPFGLGLIYLGLYTVSGWTFGEADADADADADAHIDVDTDLDGDAHVDVDHDLQADADADSDTDTDSDHDAHASHDGHASQGSAFLSALNWIGVGRMPVSLVLMILMLTWGAIGFGAIQMQRGAPIDRSVPISIAVAALGSLYITHLVASILGPLLFSNTNAPRRRHELLGSNGEAMYAIDSKFGMVVGHDERGELFQVACRVEEGKNPLPKGAAVQLVAYTAKDRMFYVVPAESVQTPRRSGNGDAS